MNRERYALSALFVGLSVCVGLFGLEAFIAQDWPLALLLLLAAAAAMYAFLLIAGGNDR